MSIDFIHIGPDTLNNVTNYDSIDSAIITGSLTLLVGLGIFFTLGLKLDPYRFYQMRGAAEGITRRVTDEIILRLRIIITIMFIIVGLGVILSLYPELAFMVYSTKVSVARIVLTIASGIVVLFIIFIIYHPPPAPPRKPNQEE